MSEELPPEWFVSSYRVVQEQHTMMGMARPHLAILILTIGLICAIIANVSGILWAVLAAVPSSAVAFALMKMLYKSDKYWLEHLWSHNYPDEFFYGE